MAGPSKYRGPSSASIDESDRMEMLEAFARAISRDDLAVIIDENNHSPMQTSISRALVHRRAFAVVPKDWFTAIDIDCADDREAGEKIVQGVPDAFQCVWTESGSAGHRHLWLIAPPGWDHALVAALILEIAPELPSRQIRAGSAVRPPYAPHRRLTTFSTVVGLDPRTALRWFQSAQKMPLARKWYDLLAEDDARQDYSYDNPTRDPLARLAAASVNARWNYEQFVHLVEMSTGALSKRYRSRPPEKRRAYLRGLWERASAFVRDRPQISYYELDRVSVAEYRSLIANLPWVGRTRASNVAVYRRLLDIAAEKGALTVGAALRDLSSDTGLAQATVGRSLNRLIEMGLIVRIPYVAPEANRYKLLNPLEMCLPEGNRISPPMGGGVVDSIALSSALLDDIFANGRGLGEGRRQTWVALSADWDSTEGVARRVGLSLPTLRAHIRVLRAHGLAERDGHRVRRLHPSDSALAALAKHLDVTGKRAQTRARNAAQQREYREGRIRLGLASRASVQPGSRLRPEGGPD